MRKKSQPSALPCRAALPAPRKPLVLTYGAAGSCTLIQAWPFASLTVRELANCFGTAESHALPRRSLRSRINMLSMLSARLKPYHSTLLATLARGLLRTAISAPSTALRTSCKCPGQRSQSDSTRGRGPSQGRSLRSRFKCLLDSDFNYLYYLSRNVRRSLHASAWSSTDAFPRPEALGYTPPLRVGAPGTSDPRSFLAEGGAVNADSHSTPSASRRQPLRAGSRLRRIIHD